jgi:purine-nucleoside phosphorylase
MSRGSFPLGEALAFFREAIPEAPKVAVVLGSGLGSLADSLENPVSVPFPDVPGFPGTGVVGHAGRFISGRLAGVPVLFQAGRFHFYEGYPGHLVVAPIRLASELGAHTVVLTNAAGGIRSDLEPGSIMMISDHLNLQARSPLTGPVVGEEIRFPDMSDPYDPHLRALAVEVADDLEITLSHGVYAAVLGPTYETPAEIRYLEAMGADAVGMSTVPEAITARARGMRVLAFSMITNKASGLSDSALDHQEVLEAGRSSGGRLRTIVQEVISRMGG